MHDHHLKKHNQFKTCLFSLKEYGNIYTKIMSPTNDVLEKRIAAHDGGLDSLTVESDQTASTFAVLSLINTLDLYVAVDRGT